MGSLRPSTYSAKSGNSFLHFDPAFDAAGNRNDPEYRYCREMEREIRTRPAGWLLMAERTYTHRSTGKVTVAASQTCRYDTEAEALAAAEKQPVGDATLYSSRSNGCDCRTTRVWVEREVK